MVQWSEPRLGIQELLDRYPCKWQFIFYKNSGFNEIWECRLKFLPWNLKAAITLMCLILKEKQVCCSQIIKLLIFESKLDIGQQCKRKKPYKNFSELSNFVKLALFLYQMIDHVLTRFSLLAVRLSATQRSKERKPLFHISAST